MKKLLLTLSLLTLSSCAYASINNSNSACSYASINLATIAKIESSGNPLAIGDNGKALGLYQLHASVVKDYNKANNTNFKHNDMLKASTAYKVANWYLNIKIPSYLRHYGIAVNRDNVLSCYNAGIGSVLKGRKAVKYIAKYNKLNKGVK